MHATHGLGDVYDVMTCDFDDDDKQHDNTLFQGARLGTSTYLRSLVWIYMGSFDTICSLRKCTINKLLISYSSDN